MENQEKKLEAEVTAEVQNAKADSALPEAEKDPQALRRESIQKAIAVLCEKFPKAFSLQQEEIRPLKIGIINDLKDRIADLDGVSLSKIRAAVRKYTYSIQYLDAVKEGTKRVDLDGNEVSEVTKEHEDYSQEQKKLVLEKLKEQNRLKLKVNKPKFAKNDKKPGFKGGFKSKKVVSEVRVKRRFAFTKPGSTAKPVNAPVPAKIEELVKGTSVLVSSNNRFVKGSVSEEPKQNTVTITLDTGLTVCVPVARVMLRKE